ncbi:hypothetical protein AVEN_48166-1 [Araneus ventricosus]|uniref:Uncharacterized protein n=1 Tax=Araneus ventricosus TaxID=182803 RepID=A0A4Y2IJU1_ARAVE|nr:hypothetical protein AVEN_48166-1 [Araneus ventricosus]
MTTPELATPSLDFYAFNDLKADILMLYVDAVSKMASVQVNGADQPNNIMERFIDLKREFSSFHIDINTEVDLISKQIALEGVARQPEFQELNLHEELVKSNLKPEVKTYVSAVRNSSSAVKRVKSDSKLVINGARKISSLKSVDRDSSTSSCKRGGGVTVAIKKNMHDPRIHVPLIDLECIWILVKLKFGKKLLLCVLYLPPASGIDQPSTEYDRNDAVEFNDFGILVGIDTVTYDDVVMAVKELKSNSTICIDNIPPFIRAVLSFWYILFLRCLTFL